MGAWVPPSLIRPSGHGSIRTRGGAGPSGLTDAAAVGGSRQGYHGVICYAAGLESAAARGSCDAFSGLDLPFRAVERQQFKDFVAMLNPEAAQLLGSRFRIARDMHAAADAATAELRQLLTADGLSGRMTLTTDIWNSGNNIAFMVVTAHWVTSDFRLQQAVLDFRSLERYHKGDRIAQELEETIEQWGLGDLFFGVTTDNAENNNRAIRLLAGVPDAIPGSRRRDPPLLSLSHHFRYVTSNVSWDLVPCCAVLSKFILFPRFDITLNLSTIYERAPQNRSESCELWPATSGGQCSVRSGSSNIQSRLATAEIADQQVAAQGVQAARPPAEGKRLIIDSPTRWGSTLEMVVRALELHMPLTMFFDDTTVS
ncbi:unnamed protein product [Closterium sp. Yama58-4]|nr:unnamed protein product [Closterium sp. Yama58-4]